MFSFISNLKIRTKLFIAFSIVILIGIIAIVINIQIFNSINQKTDYIFGQIDPVRLAAFDLHESFDKDIRAIEEFGNGYAKADETEGVVSMNEDKIAEDIKTIEKSGFVAKAETESLKAILARDEVEDEKVFAARENEKINTKQHIVSPEAQKALEGFDSVSTEVSDAIDRVFEHIATYKANKIKELNIEVTKSKIIVVEAFALSVIVSFFVSLFVVISLSNAIRNIKNAASKMSEGDFSQRITNKSNDELGRVARTLNQMAESIQKSQSDLESVNFNLKEKLDELEKFQRLTIGRELVMADLKDEIKRLGGGSKRKFNKR